MASVSMVEDIVMQHIRDCEYLEIDPEKIDPNISLVEYGFDSMDGLHFMYELEEKFDLKFGIRDNIKRNEDFTINKVIDEIKKSLV